MRIERQRWRGMEGGKNEGGRKERGIGHSSSWKNLTNLKKDWTFEKSSCALLHIWHIWQKTPALKEQENCPKESMPCVCDNQYFREILWKICCQLKIDEILSSFQENFWGEQKINWSLEPLNTFFSSFLFFDIVSKLPTEFKYGSHDGTSLGDYWLNIKGKE